MFLQNRLLDPLFLRVHRTKTALRIKPWSYDEVRSRAKPPEYDSRHKNVLACTEEWEKSERRCGDGRSERSGKRFFRVQLFRALREDLHLLHWFDRPLSLCHEEKSSQKAANCLWLLFRAHISLEAGYILLGREIVLACVWQTLHKNRNWRIKSSASTFISAGFNWTRSVRKGKT